MMTFTVGTHAVGSSSLTSFVANSPHPDWWNDETWVEQLIKKFAFLNQWPGHRDWRAGVLGESATFHLPSSLSDPATFQRKGLVLKHGLHYHVAGRFYIEAVVSDQIVTFGNDQVGVLQDLQLFVAVVLVQPHALTDEFKNVHNARNGQSRSCAHSSRWSE